MKTKTKPQPTKDALTKSDIKRVCDILRRDDGVGAKDYIEQFSWLLFLKVFEGVESQLKELEEAEGRKYKPVIDAEYQWSTWAKKDWKDKDELIHFINQKLFPYLKSLKGTREKDKIGEIFRELSGNRIRSPHNLLDVIGILDKIEKHHFQDTHLLSQVYEEILQAMGSEGGWSGEFYTPRPIIRLMVKIVNPELGEAIFDPFVGSGGFLVESFDHLYEKSTKDVRSWKTLQTKTFYGQEKKPLPFLIGTMNLILHNVLNPNIRRENTLKLGALNVPESEKYDVILTNPPFGGEEDASVQNVYPFKTASTEGMALQYIIRHLKNGGRCGIVLPEGDILFGGGAMQQIRMELLEKCNLHTIISLPRGVFKTTSNKDVKTSLLFFDKTGPTKETFYVEVSGRYTKAKSVKDEDFVDLPNIVSQRKKTAQSWAVSIKDLEKNGYSLIPKNPKNTTSGYTHDLEDTISSLRDLPEKIELLVSSMKSDTLKSKYSFRNVSIGDEKLFTIIQGKTPKKSEYQSEDNGRKIVKFRDLKENNSIVWDNPEGGYVNEGVTGLKELRDGYVLVTNSAHSPEQIGRKVAIVKNVPKKKNVFFVGELTAIAPNAEYVLPDYLFLWLSSRYGYEAIQARVKEKHLIKSEIAKIEVPLPLVEGKPSVEAQKEIIEAIGSQRENVDVLLSNLRGVVEKISEFRSVGLGKILYP